MMQGSLHPVPRGRDILREQIRFVALSLRAVTLVVAVVLSIVTVKIVIDSISGDAASWFDSEDWTPIGFLSFLLPFAIWRGEKRFGPAFLWTLPVDRRRLALAKVFAGWVWMIVAIVIVIVWQLVLALFAGVEDPQLLALTVFIGATGTYLLGSALVLGLRHPLRWLLGSIAVIVILNKVNAPFDDARYGIGALLNSRAFQSSLNDAVSFVPFLILAAGLAALWGALARHGEHRRH